MLDKPISEEKLSAILNTLVDQGYINVLDGYYSISEAKPLLAKRLLRNKNVDKYIDIARKKARLIYSFPFVRGVFISGSLSKDCVEEDGDIDFFILTQKNRLWLCRALLIIYKKIFLLNSYRYFCLNYFIDEENLEIDEKNLYTATELVTLIPAAGVEMCEAFMDANLWTDQFRPSFPKKEILNQNESRTLRFKNWVEWICKGQMGDYLNEKMMNFFVQIWKKKFKHFSPEKFNKAMKSSEHVSKHHPNDFQHKVMSSFESKILDFEKSKGISLS